MRKGVSGYSKLSDPEEDIKTSFSVLSYKEMEKINLPANIGISPDYFDDILLPLEDKVIPKGHKFRPYRIASSSFVMNEDTIESNW